MKIVFMGTPDFAANVLKNIIKNYKVDMVVTQPDKPKGRGLKVILSKVKEIAVENNIPVYQPVKIKSDIALIEKIKELKPDVIVVAAYGQILSEEILNIPTYGCINVHASLLPELRGAAPINWAIINGLKSTGITIMKMEKGLDTGDMLLKGEVKIGDDETAGCLHDRLMELGGELIIEALKKIEKNELVPEKQNDEDSSYAPMMDKETGHIDWNKNVSEVYNRIRGVLPFPGAYFIYKDKVIKIWKAKKVDDKRGNIGEIIEVSKDGILIGCKDGAILVEEIQETGGKRMNIASYLNGHEINIKEKLY